MTMLTLAGKFFAMRAIRIIVYRRIFAGLQLRHIRDTRDRRTLCGSCPTINVGNAETFLTNFFPI